MEAIIPRDLINIVLEYLPPYMGIMTRSTGPISGKEYRKMMDAILIPPDDDNRVWEGRLGSINDVFRAGAPYDEGYVIRVIRAKRSMPNITIAHTPKFLYALAHEGLLDLIDRVPLPFLREDTDGAVIRKTVHIMMRRAFLGRGRGWWWLATKMKKLGPSCLEEMLPRYAGVFADEIVNIFNPEIIEGMMTFVTPGMIRAVITPSTKACNYVVVRTLAPKFSWNDWVYTLGIAPWSWQIWRVINETVHMAIDMRPADMTEKEAYSFLVRSMFGVPTPWDLHVLRTSLGKLEGPFSDAFIAEYYL